MRLIIAGSRAITDYRIIIEALDASPWQACEIDEVVSGCARGVDTLGEQWAAVRRIPVTRCPAEWDKYERSAGPIRNSQMAARADALLLIWDGKSRGSASMKREAEKRGLKIYEYIVEAH